MWVSRCEGVTVAEKEMKPDLASLVADIAREECRKLYEKHLTEDKLAALYNSTNRPAGLVLSFRG
jgi:hypothetical protein